jgi:hypothetical protein
MRRYNLGSVFKVRNGIDAIRLRFPMVFVRASPEENLWYDNAKDCIQFIAQFLIIDAFETGIV